MKPAIEDQVLRIATTDGAEYKVNLHQVNQELKEKLARIQSLEEINTKLQAAIKDMDSNDVAPDFRT